MLHAFPFSEIAIPTMLGQLNESPVKARKPYKNTLWTDLQSFQKHEEAEDYIKSLKNWSYVTTKSTKIAEKKIL